MEPAPPPHHGGCPRCGAKILEPYKYCPNCAYRLRPELIDLPPVRPERSRIGPRLLALASYLAFGSLLLLVVLVGFRLFSEPQVELGTPQITGVARDHNAIPLTKDDFLWVGSGEVLWGLFDANAQPAIVPRVQEQVDDDFRLAVHEVTNDQYYEFLLAWARRSGMPVPKSFYPTTWVRSTGRALVSRIYPRGRGNHPVTDVSFGSALRFCGWVWEEVFDSHPDVVVDLPTAYEYTLAARGDDLDNFPWGGQLERGRANLDIEAVAVDDERFQSYDGFRHLVGNVAEWVYGLDPYRSETSAGWSYRDPHHYRIWDDPSLTNTTPFQDEAFEIRAGGSARREVGFRVVVRRTPALPTFRRVSKGEVRHERDHFVEANGRPIERMLPPFDFREGREVPERFPPVSFPEERDVVAYEFEIAEHEITNRQYLYFLTDVAPRLSAGEVDMLLPRRFTRTHPFARDPHRIPTVFTGHYGDPDRIDRVYEAGSDNHPVEGVTPGQAKAYAEWLSRQYPASGFTCSLPTVAQYLRAGRGNAATPYPWGDDRHDPLLVCAGRSDDLGRARSLLQYTVSGSREIVGLCGNVAEYVWDKHGERLLLAGGFYDLWAENCTLDSFFDIQNWGSIDVWRPLQPWEVEELVTQHICDAMICSRDDISHSTEFVRDLGARAQNMQELAENIESEFGLRIRPEDFSTLKTVGDLFARVKRHGGRPVRLPYQLAPYAGLRVVRVMERF